MRERRGTLAAAWLRRTFYSLHSSVTYITYGVRDDLHHDSIEPASISCLSQSAVAVAVAVAVVFVCRLSSEAVVATGVSVS